MKSQSSPAPQKKRSLPFWQKVVLTSVLLACSSYLYASYSHNPDTSSLEYLYENFLDIHTRLVSSLTQKSASSSNSRNTDSNTKMASADAWKNAQSVYEFSATDINGKLIDLSHYKGRVLLIVNVACNCGFTAGNYPQLQELHRKHEHEGFSVLAFPCNQFGGQEPGTEQDIKEFTSKFGIDFTMFSKIKVNGDDAHPLYKYLKMKQGGTLISAIKWNFSKFLVNRRGQPVNRYSPTTEPKDIENDILKCLKEEAPKL